MFNGIEVKNAYLNEKIISNFNRILKIYLFFFLKLFGIYRIEEKKINIDPLKYPKLSFVDESKSKVILANHVSFLDIPVFSYLENSCYISKSSVQSYPIIGFLAQFA